eukprot:1157118-Pelagomonas_calceolata.AAC.1
MVIADTLRVRKKQAFHHCKPEGTRILSHSRRNEDMKEVKECSLHGWADQTTEKRKTPARLPGKENNARQASHTAGEGQADNQEAQGERKTKLTRGLKPKKEKM